MLKTHYSWPCCSLFLWNLVGKALSLCLMTLILTKLSVTISNLRDMVLIAFTFSRHVLDPAKL
ncbi:unnamed protein product [Brassica oleracea]